jgi:hypothetical protein
MKKLLVVALAIGLVVLVAGCSGGDTTTTLSSETTTSSDDSSAATGDTSTTSPSEPTTVAPSGALPTVGHEQTDSRFVYAGKWKSVTLKSASGHSVAMASSSSCSVTIRFTGTSLSWLATVGPGYGKAKVTLDGGASKTVDLYSKSAAYKHTVYQTGKLTNKAHTVVIAYTGKKNSAATGKSIDVDAITVTGVLTGRYQQNNPKLSYSGTWKTGSSPSASGGTYGYTSSSKASVIIRFTGTQLAWLAKVGPSYGRANVTVDGSKPMTIELYSAAIGWQKRVWSSGTLELGAHTVKIFWTGTKNSKASGTTIDIDALDVTGILN